MLTHEEIVKGVVQAATKFSLEKILYFGSYADGKATEESDLDLLVEFTDDESISLLDIIKFTSNLEKKLNICVDVVGLPSSEMAKKRIKIKANGVCL